jgi:hypothetical protein
MARRMPNTRFWQQRPSNPQELGFGGAEERRQVAGAVNDAHEHDPARLRAVEVRNPDQGGQRVRSKVGSESDLSWAAIPTKVGTRPG